MTLVAAVVAICVLTPAATASGCADDQASNPDPAPAAAPAKANAKPILILLHSGGFVLGDPSTLEDAAKVAAELGFEPVAFAYPLADLKGAVDAVDAEALQYRRARRRVYAYGEAAGGLLAALLSENDRVEAAATYSQITDLRKYIDHLPNPDFYQTSIEATDRQVLRYSPGFGRPASPLLALIGADEDRYFNRSTLRWDERERLVRAREVGGAHLAEGQPAVYVANVSSALRWLARRADLR